MYSVTIDKRGGFVHAPRNKMTADNSMVNLTQQKTKEVNIRIYEHLFNDHRKKKYGCQITGSTIWMPNATGSEETKNNKEFIRKILRNK